MRIAKRESVTSTRRSVTSTRRWVRSAALTWLLAGLFAASSSPAAPAAASVTVRLADPALISSIVGSTLALAAAQPGLFEVARALDSGTKLANKAVLKPKKYATRIIGTATYRLKLDVVRELTRAWFAPLK